MDKRVIAEIILKVWLAAFIATGILSFIEVKEESNSAFWLAKQCSENAELRTNIQQECIRAMTKMKTGYTYYVFYSFIHRIKFCGTYSCTELVDMFFVDFWQAARITLSLVVITFIANPILIDSVKDRLPRNRVISSMGQKIKNIAGKFKKPKVYIEDVTADNDS